MHMKKLNKLLYLPSVCDSHISLLLPEVVIFVHSKTNLTLLNIFYFLISLTIISNQILNNNA